MREKLCLALVLLAALAAGGCRHKPVYPELGSLIVTSLPTNAAIYVDGAYTGHRTPAKLDGIPVGSRSISLKLSRFKTYRGFIEIRPGETRRMNLVLTAIEPHVTARFTLPVPPRDMAYDPVRQRLYLSHKYVSWVGVYQIADSAVAKIGEITVGPEAVRLACHPGLGRLAVCVKETVKVIDLNSWGTVGWTVPAPGTDYHRLAYTPDGRALLAADSAGRRVLILDPQSGALVRSIGLPGCVNDLAVEPGSRWFYATLTAVERFVRVDLESGAVLNEMATGPTPGTVFQDDDGEFAGFCNVFGRRFVPLRLASWTSIETPLLPNPTPLPEGDYIWGACFSGNRESFWIFRTPGVETGNPGIPLPVGTLFLFDRNTWSGIFNTPLGQFPMRMIQSQDGRFLYFMEFYDLQIMRTDTE
jgi:hypothetical protein